MGHAAGAGLVELVELLFLPSGDCGAMGVANWPPQNVTGGNVRLIIW